MSMSEMQQEVFGEPSLGLIAEGAASITSAVVADLHNAYMGVFFGDGQVSPPPYLTSSVADDMQSGLSKIVEGLGEMSNDHQPEMDHGMTM